MHVKYGVDHISGSPFSVHISMANYSDLFSIVDRPATTSVPADKSAQPTVKIHNDEIDSLERLIKFEQQRMETIQKTTIDLLGEVRYLTSSLSHI